MKITVSLQGMLLVTVAVTSSRAEGGDPSQPGGNLSNLTEGGDPSQPGGVLYAAGNLSNLTAGGDPQMSEGNNFISIRASSIERGACEITKTCKRAGGHCVMKQKYCSGAVDKRTCLGRKCMCCMPDVVKGCSPTLSCCSAGGHCVRNGGYCESGVLDQSGCNGKNCKCCLPPSDYLTTTATEERTHTATSCPVGEGFILVPGSNQCLKAFNETGRSWASSNEKCQFEGLVLARTDDPIALRTYLMKHGVTNYSWLGARSVGSYFRWQSDNSVISSSSSYWYAYSTNDKCLMFLTTQFYLKWGPTEPFFAVDCTSMYPLTICELV